MVDFKNISRRNNLYKKGVKLFLREGIFPLIRKMREYLFGYELWIKNNEPDEVQLDVQRAQVLQMVNPPLISIVIPVYATPVAVLKATINSVTDQIYTNWQLRIANGSPENQTITDLLNEFVSLDERIRVVSMKHNLGIAGNTNAAISLADGEYIAFLDHDDTLAPFALYKVVRAIQEHPESDILYSDEDILSADGKNRNNPYFKSAFSMEFLRSNNYMCHFLVIKRSIGETIGWLSENYEGAQDFDLILRAIEKSKYITHIPQILYHWRALPGSTARGTEEKAYASDAGVRAVQDHLDRLHIPAVVALASLPTNYRTHYKIKGDPSISIIIPNHDHASYLCRCVESIINKTSYRNFEIVVVENQSHDQNTLDLYNELTQNPKISKIEFQEPFNFSQINNFAANKVQSDYLLFLNNDTEIDHPDWLDEMILQAVQPGVGIVGAKLDFPDGSLQHGGVFLGGSDEIPGHSHKHAGKGVPGYHGRLFMPQDLSAVTGACLLIRREIFEAVQGFDETYTLAFGDVDLCLKVREKGYRVVWTPFASLTHYESQTRGYEDTPEKKERFDEELGYFRRKWEKVLVDGDPYYNPNLVAGGRYNCAIRKTPYNQRPRCLPVNIAE
jgi:O-antigen biosynthesis protein